MGLFRKMTSVSTLGMVDYRSDKERVAKYTRQTRNATRAAALQNGLMLNNQREQLAQSHVHHVEAQVNAMVPPPYVPQSIPAGWYDDGRGAMRWYDGMRWTPHTR